MDLDDLFSMDLANAEAHDDEFVIGDETMKELGFDINHPIFQNLENEETIENSQSNTGNLLNQSSASSENYQSNTTDICHRVAGNQLTTADSIVTYDRDRELYQFNRLDEAWRNLLKKLRINENRLIQRNVPRLMVTYNNSDEVCPMNCTSRILLNAPIITRVMFRLDSDANSQLIISATIQAKQNLFYTLLEIMRMTYKSNQNENIDVQLVQSFGEKYEALYSQGVNWIEQDSGVFYSHLMDMFKSMVNDENQAEYLSKAFEIKTFTGIANGQIQIVKEHVIQISSTIDDFVECINKLYSYIPIQDSSGQIQQQYAPLPEQILLVDNRPEKNSHIPYPAEFHTCNNQYYLLTGSVACNIRSFNGGDYVAMICRQNSVYILDNNRLIDRFHTNYVPEFFASVYPRIVLYTEVDPLRGNICAFEDPLAEIIAGRPSRELLGHCTTENSVTPTQCRISMPPVDQPPMIIRHPVLSTFRYRMDTDFSRGHIIVSLEGLKDCLEDIGLYLWPRSVFKDAFIEAMLVFKAPDGQCYRSHYRFVRTLNSKNKFENPTYFSVEQKDNEEWFPFTAIISKSKQDTFQPKAEHSDATDQDNQHDYTCQIVRYPDGESEVIDEEKLRSFMKNPEDKKSKRRMSNGSSGKVTPFKLSKVIDINTVYVALRRVRRVSENEYVPDSDVLFLSNPFRPVSSSVKKIQYDYSSDKLKIESLLREPSPDTNNPSMVYSLSYSIPRETYICTGLKDKYIQVTIHKSNDDESTAHPLYQIWDGQTRFASREIAVTEYSSTLTIHIVRRSQDELENLTNSSAVQGVHNLQSISNSSTIKSFRIQLQLGHLSNGQFTGYPKSAVKSDMILDNMPEEQQSSSSAPAADVIESNDTLTNSTPAHLKRPHTDEDAVSADSTPKSLKHN